MCLALLVVVSGRAHAEQFKEYEVRVIKNKFFQKRMRLELSGSTSAIMNKSFITTVLGGASLGFHFTESIGAYGEGHVGYTFKSSDCNTLGKSFRIEPLLDITNWWAGGGVAYTPIYGKYQMGSGRVVYFDWIFTLGGGLVDVLHKEHDTCVDPNDRLPNEAPDAGALNQRAQKIHLNVGTGQKFYLNENLSLNWNLKVMAISPFFEDGFMGAINGFRSPSILLMLGASYFL